MFLGLASSETYTFQQHLHLAHTAWRRAVR
jgi:hypothetical protein